MFTPAALVLILSAASAVFGTPLADRAVTPRYAAPKS